MEVGFRAADLADAGDAATVIRLLNDFSQHADGKRLSDDINASIVQNLIDVGNARVYFAETASGVIGIAICFYGFSTFMNKKLLNIHDFYVDGSCRGAGVGTRFLRFIEDDNRKDCCKITLEVYKSNAQGLHVYEKSGFLGSLETDGNYVIYAMHKYL